MITGKDLGIEIKKLELVAEKGDERVVNRAIVKGIALLLKLLKSMRSNQVARMKKDGVKLFEPRLPSKDGVKTEAKVKKEE